MGVPPVSSSSFHLPLVLALRRGWDRPLDPPCLCAGTTTGMEWLAALHLWERLAGERLAQAEVVSMIWLESSAWAQLLSYFMPLS